MDPIQARIQDFLRGGQVSIIIASLHARSSGEGITPLRSSGGVIIPFIPTPENAHAWLHQRVK